MKDKNELTKLIKDINFFVNDNKESFVFTSVSSDLANKTSEMINYNTNTNTNTDMADAIIDECAGACQNNFNSNQDKNQDQYSINNNVSYSKTEALNYLKTTKINQCTKCALSKTRKNIVFGEGNPESRLMFIGEAPGAEEDNTGRPFVGRAGQLLTKIIESINLKREEVYIANIIKCRPPENRNPMEDEIASCAPFLKEQIAIIRPEIICTLGKFSTEFIIGEGKGSISSVRGKTYNYGGITVIPTYHPSYLLRNPSAKKETWEDMKKIRELYFK
jgi:DNA polymerase